MKKSLLVLPIFFLSVTSLLAQDLTRFYEIAAPPKLKIQNSLYNSINFLDSRADSAMIGEIAVGLLKNHPAKFILKTPVLPQLRRLLNSLTDSTAKNGELLFQLKHFRFVETIGTRNCFLSANLYVKRDRGYQKISTLDTLVVIGVSDIAGVLTPVANNILFDFMATSLQKQPGDSTYYSEDDVKNIDEIEARRFPLYSNANYTDGLYYDYTSFKNQTPDKQAFVNQHKDGNIASVKIVDSNGKRIRVGSEKIYAVVHNGMPFIATEYGYYPLQKAGSDLLFTGDVRIAASRGDIAGGQFALGLIGAALASRGNRETYIMIINHLNGKFIYLRSIKKEDDDNIH